MEGGGRTQMPIATKFFTNLNYANFEKPLSSIFIFLSHCALVALQLRNPCRPSPAIRWLQKPNDIFIILKLCVTNHIPNYSVQLEKQIYYNACNG